ncbi:MAG: cytochrome-c oxidase, cbb3-type subunit III [Alphaproteobacteria bacterium]|nr:cytochrome-c oxidase, cbb3-type subunit III [Alphaproteobacteria bacterium]
MSDKREIDPVTGQETTGHEWDGIRELDTPMPRWWLWTFYATIAWSVAYMIAMPAIPLVSDYTKGVLGYSQRESVRMDIAEAREAQSGLRSRIEEASLEEILDVADLREFAVAGGQSAFAVNCSQCHGSGGAGAPGYPNLNDDAWVWGGSLERIHEIIRVGIRSEHPDTLFNEMPAFLKDELLPRDQVDDVVEYVLAISGQDHEVESADRGRGVFLEQCAACHMESGKGDRELGAPNLTDAIWLYGGDRESIWNTVADPRNGVMPNWDDKLDPVTRKQLAIYVHQLGGGE